MASHNNHKAAANTAEDINLLSTFLSNSEIVSLHPPVTIKTSASSDTASEALTTSIAPSTIIVAPSAILHQAHCVFSFFQTHLPSTNTVSSSISTLIFTGGIGHSTTHLYDAIMKHSVYSALPSRLSLPTSDLTGRSEAELFHLIFVHFYDGENVSLNWNDGCGLRVLVEGQSTNCGANAALSKALLAQNQILLGSTFESADSSEVEHAIIVQDPTMSLRTKASFEKVYESEVSSGSLRFWTWPIFVPSVMADETGNVIWDKRALPRIDTAGLWDMKRFNGLVLGEIPRLRDDENGYGPNGKGFIGHVNVPTDVNDAWRRLNSSLDFQR